MIDTANGITYRIFNNLGVSAVNNGHGTFPFINEILTLVRNDEVVTVIDPAQPLVIELNLAQMKLTSSSSMYQYQGGFSFGVLPDVGGVEFNLLLTVSQTTPIADITGLSGSVTYSGILGNYTSTNLSFGTGVGNGDGALISLNVPFFSTDGFTFNDNDVISPLPPITYHIFSVDDDVVDVTDLPAIPIVDFFDLDNESLTLSCLLSTTKILTPTGYRLIKDIEVGDSIVSEGDRVIKVVGHRISQVSFDCWDDYPCKIPAGKLGAIEDTYLTKGHAIKFDSTFGSPSTWNCRHLTLADLHHAGITEIEYHHLELECAEGENRRTNTLIANGVIVESFSNDLL